MPSDYYADAAAPPAASTSESPESAEPKEGDMGDSQTAVLPLSVLGGKEWKPGDEIVLQIVQMNEDGAVVKYATEEPEEEEESAAPAEASNPGGGGGGMSSMYG